MNNVRVILATIAPLLVLGACATPMKVQSHSDPEAATRIATYKTYRWLAPPSGGDKRINNQLVANRIQSAIDRVMAAKGKRSS